MNWEWDCFIEGLAPSFFYKLVSILSDALESPDLSNALEKPSLYLFQAY